MPRTAHYTAAEAAFVLREPVRTVKKALDVGPIRPVLQAKAGMTVRTIGEADLVYLFALRELREELTPKARLSLYEALRDMPDKPTRDVRFGRFRVDIGDLLDDVERRIAKLDELSGKIEFRADGEPLLKGTDIEVYRIAALLDGGLSADAIREDYPSLSKTAVETAGAYAAAHPKVGRPYPRMTAKRALKGAGLEALDGIMD